MNVINRYNFFAEGKTPETQIQNNLKGLGFDKLNPRQ